MSGFGRSKGTDYLQEELGNFQRLLSLCHISEAGTLIFGWMYSMMLLMTKEELLISALNAILILQSSGMSL